MSSKRIHWTTKLKAENARLKSDIYKILDGDFNTVTLYQTYRKLEKDTERVVWFGDTDSLLSKTKD